MAKLHPQVARTQAAQAVVDRFDGAPFVWGSADCIRPAAMVLRKLGHKVAGLAKAGSYSSQRGALRALKQAGFTTLEEALDAQGLPRISAAEALPGDILALPSDDENGWPALTVVVGNGRVLGFMADGDAVRCGVLAPHVFSGICWRVAPCLK